MDTKYEDSNNYSILSTNLTNSSNKFKNIYRMSSPVLIQSYGDNNFAVELKYNKKNKNNDEFDFIENELKKNKNNKAYTTYTEISNEESLFFGAQNPKPKKISLKGYIHYDKFYPDNIYKINKMNYLLDKNNNYHPYKKEEIESLLYPREKIYVSRKNFINQTNKKLQYPRFHASFISKSPNSACNNSHKKKIFRKKENGIITCNKTLGNKNERSISKSKNQLQDYNIDKLKEIGDDFFMRYFNKITPKKSFNFYNNINNIATVSEKKPKHDGLINKMIMIEQKRKESKSKLNLFNKTEDKIKTLNKNERYDFSENKKLMTLNEDLNTPHQTKMIKKIKNDENIIKIPINTKKIRISNLIRRKKYFFQKENNSNGIENGLNGYILSDNKNNYINGFNPRRIYQKTNNRINLDIKKEKSNNNINNQIVICRSKGNNSNIKNKNINQNSIESINIKNNKKFKKNPHSFNNVILSLQK